MRFLAGVFGIGAFVVFWIAWCSREDSPTREKWEEFPVGAPALLAGYLFTSCVALSLKITTGLDVFDDPIAAAAIIVSAMLAGIPGLYCLCAYFWRYYRLRTGSIASLSEFRALQARDSLIIGYVVGIGTLVSMPVMGFWVGLERGQWLFFAVSSGFLLLFGLLFYFHWAIKKKPS